MNELDVIRVLIVEDDEEDMILARDLLHDIKGHKFETEWARNYDDGLNALSRNLHDICLVDYRLGAHDGIELIKAAKAGGSQVPVILLTGMGQKEVDMAAMKAGAASYLVKGNIESEEIERTIRYAIERKLAASRAAFEQARLAAFGAQVGLALTQERATLPVVLDCCAKAMAQYLGATLAQLWVFDPVAKTFALSASAGPALTAPDQDNKAFPFESVLQGKALVVSDLSASKEFSQKQWASRLGIVSFAAYPLTLEDRLVGCMSLYSSEPLTETILQEMTSVASGVALYIQRKRAEDALDASENRYRSVVSSIREVVFQMTEFGYWSFLNPAWETITGFAVKDTIGKFFLEYFHPDDRDRARDSFLKLVNGEAEQCQIETRLFTQPGEMRWVEMSLCLSRDESGTILGASGSLFDITERKNTEAQIQRLAAFPRANPNPVLELSACGKITYSNTAAAETVRILGKQLMTEILPPGFAEIAADCLKNGRKHLREEVTISEHTIRWSFFPVQENKVVHCYGVDITDMLTLEAQYRHAQKLESVGQMAAGIAHDFNNILTVIQGYSDCLLSSSTESDSSNGPLKQISSAARRAAALTRQLLTFSRKQVLQARPLDLNYVLRNFSKMLPRILGEDIALETDFVDGLPAIEADPNMIEQVVMNLAVNARDAMPRGGCLVVTTRLQEIGEDYARQKPEARPGNFVSLSVKDTGCGMDQQTLARIFEPFFSTKDIGRGTGLGLATVYGIVKQHQGWVEVSSAVGVGTTFTVFFPAISAKVVQPEETDDSAPASAPGKRETILLVEDEQVLRELVGKVLRQYDYRVIEASNGVEALKVREENKGNVDLLLTDMVMPEGISGGELAERLRKLKPDLRIIYSSGYSSEIVGKNFSENDPIFLAKPYRPPQLAHRVRKCLDTPPQPLLDNAAISAEFANNAAKAAV